MNKIKKIWTENKILLVLAIILIICLVIFISVSVTYFYGSSSDKYGNRLDVIKDVPLNDQLFKDIKDELSKDQAVLKTEIETKGKIVYTTITFVEGTKVDDAKKVAEIVPTLYNEDELAVYDLQFTIKSEGENAFTLMGARNSNGSGVIVWNNKAVQEG